MECESIIKIILPAVRVSVSKALIAHGLTQTEVADKLGIVQAAVSKSVTGKHSKKIEKLSKYITNKGLADEIIKSILAGKQSSMISTKIDRLCESLLNNTAAMRAIS
ncbi:MAG: helix-turn-helix domain-containing protein [Candidatus Micrarchaeaceae archaeon]